MERGHRQVPGRQVWMRPSEYLDLINFRLNNNTKRKRDLPNELYIYFTNKGKAAAKIERRTALAASTEAA
jgi:hypothetical protein